MWTVPPFPILAFGGVADTVTTMGIGVWTPLKRFSAAGVIVATVGAGTACAAPGKDAALVEPVMDESATEVDLLNTEVLIPPVLDFAVDGQTITLTDGAYDEGDPDPFRNNTYAYHIEPLYADLDGDMDLDAAAILHHSMYERGYQYLIVWLWEDDELVQVDRTMSGVCTVDTLNPRDSGVELTLTSVAARESCYALGADETLNETVTVSVVDGNLVQSELVFGAVDRCHPLYWQELVTLDSAVTPRTAPDRTAPAVAEPGDDVAIHLLAAPHRTDTSEWHIAQVVVDGVTACGWVHNDEIPASG